MVRQSKTQFEYSASLGVPVVPSADMLTALSGAWLEPGNWDDSQRQLTCSLIQEAICNSKLEIESTFKVIYSDETLCAKTFSPLSTRAHQAAHPKERWITSILSASVLGATQVHVENASYWYQRRRELGGAFHFKRDVSEAKRDITNKLSSRPAFEAFSYTKQTSKAGDLVTTRVSAGTALMPLQAWTLADNACTARDASPATMASETQQRGRELLCSHFRGIVVSPLFIGLNQMCRLDLVINAILSSPQTEDAAIIHRLRKYDKSRLVDQLEKLLSSQIALKLMTPAQWKPQLLVHTCLRSAASHRADSSKKSSSHATFTEATIRLKQVESSSVLKSLLDQSVLQSHNQGSTAPGKCIGHFFYSLRPDHQRYLLAKQHRAIETLEQAQHKKTAADFLSNEQAGEALNSGRMLTASVLSRAVRDPIKEQRRKNAIVASWLTVAHRQEAELACRLQRVCRTSLLTRALCQRKSKNRAIIDIQRIARGQLGRTYSCMLIKVANLAARSIATRYRRIIATGHTNKIRVVNMAAAIKIQNVTRMHHAATYVAWIRWNWSHASHLNSCARQLLNSNQGKLLLVWRISSGTPAPWNSGALASLGSVLISAQLRGLRCRFNFLATLSVEIQRKIIGPARSLLQRIARGSIGRYITRCVEKQCQGAVEIQRVARGHLKVLWRKRACAVKLQAYSLIQVQKISRGHLDRIFVQLKRSETWRIRLRVLVLPHLQACIRRTIAGKLAKRRKRMIVSSKTIQHSWRQFSLQKQAMLAHYQRLFQIQARATTYITRQVRGLVARKRFSSMRHAAAGSRLKSARTILRAWLRHRSVMRFAILKGEWEVEKSTKILMASHSLRTDVRLDMADIRADIRGARASRRWTRKRLRALRTFIAESELRLPKIESQMTALNVADVENGWKEALENEWERLTSQLAMAVQEKRLMKIQVSRCDTALLHLQLEYEDTETDVDDIAMREQEEFELLRRLEIRRADVRANTYWQTRVRHERMRWRVRDVRTRILKRERKTMASLLNTALRNREVAISSTISTLKRQQLLQDAMREAVKFDRAKRCATLEAASADKAGAINKLSRSCETALSSCALTLGNCTLGLRG